MFLQAKKKKEDLEIEKENIRSGKTQEIFQALLLRGVVILDLLEKYLKNLVL